MPNPLPHSRILPVRYPYLSRIHLAVTILPLFASTMTHAQDRPGPVSVESYLQQGKLADAERVLGDDLKAKSEDDQARFALGVVPFLRAVGDGGGDVLDDPVPARPGSV